MSKQHQAKSIIAGLIILASMWVEAAARMWPLPQERTRVHQIQRTDAEEVRSPGETLRAARTMYIEPSPRIDSKYVQYQLLKTDLLAEWGITLVEDADAADLVLRLDQVRLNYLFTILDPHTRAVIVSGKVVAINDPVAADYLGREIIKRMRDVRRTADLRPPRKREND